MVVLVFCTCVRRLILLVGRGLVDFCLDGGVCLVICFVMCCVVLILICIVEVVGLGL